MQMCSDEVMRPRLWFVTWFIWKLWLSKNIYSSNQQYSNLETSSVFSDDSVNAVLGREDIASIVDAYFLQSISK